MTIYKRPVCPYCKTIENKNPKNIDLLNKQCYNCNMIYRVIKVDKCLYRSCRMEEFNEN